MNTLIKPPCYNLGDAKQVLSHLTNKGQNKANQNNGYILINGAVSIDNLFYTTITAKNEDDAAKITDLLSSHGFTMITRSNTMKNTLDFVNRLFFKEKCPSSIAIEAMTPGNGRINEESLDSLAKFLTATGYAAVFNHDASSTYCNHSVYEERFKEYEEYRITNLLVAEVLKDYLEKRGITFFSGLERIYRDVNLDDYTKYVGDSTTGKPLMTVKDMLDAKNKANPKVYLRFSQKSSMFGFRGITHVDKQNNVYQVDPVEFWYGRWCGPSGYFDSFITFVTRVVRDEARRIKEEWENDVIHGFLYENRARLFEDISTLSSLSADYLLGIVEELGRNWLAKWNTLSQSDKQFYEDWAAGKVKFTFKSTKIRGLENVDS